MLGMGLCEKVAEGDIVAVLAAQDRDTGHKGALMPGVMHSTAYAPARAAPPPPRAAAAIDVFVPQLEGKQASS